MHTYDTYVHKKTYKVYKLQYLPYMETHANCIISRIFKNNRLNEKELVCKLSTMYRMVFQ